MSTSTYDDAGFALASQPHVPLRVLLIEDSEPDADLLVDMLEDEIPGVVVEVAVTVAAALPLLAGPLDIAITDLSLPDAEGLQALNAILAARPDIAVVVITGRQDRKLALQAMAQGAEDYLVKGAHDARGIATAVLYANQRRSAEINARRYERLALSLLDAMEASTCAVDQDGTIIAVNKSWRDFAELNGGNPTDTGVGRSYFEVCGDALGQDIATSSQIARGLRNILDGKLTRFELAYECQSAGAPRWLSIRINHLPDAGAVLTHIDVTIAKIAENALSHLTMHDPLTNLPNRLLLFDRLAQALAFAGRTNLGVAVAFLDIDQFKRINDSLGHSAGDELLRAVADRVSRGAREGDTISRYAGDEFVLVWPRIKSHEEAAHLAERLAESLNAPFELETATVSITASIGYVLGHPPQAADELLLDADAAMYDAKSRGRGRTRMYTDEMREGVTARLRTEVELRESLDRQEFVLHYQPVIDLRSHRVTGVEALVRWQHPDGLRMPDSFIPVAEATGLIVPLGTWVVEEACRQGAEWAARGLDLEIAVNFSARQIGHPDVIDSIRRALEKSKMRPERLIAEVTESSVVEDAEIAQLAFAQIRELGAAVAIDDFGTGYSSLLYLKRYPITALKVDRQFVAGMTTNDDDFAIVASVISLARAVGAFCIAEGVETADQYAALAHLGCEYAQGYLFSRPVPAEELDLALQKCAAMLDLPAPRLSVLRSKFGEQAVLRSAGPSAVQIDQAL